MPIPQTTSDRLFVDHRSDAAKERNPAAAMALIGRL